MKLRSGNLAILALLAAAIQFASPAILASHEHTEEASHEQRQSSHDSSKCQLSQIAGSIRNLDSPAPITLVSIDLIQSGQIVLVSDLPHQAVHHRLAQPRAPPIA